MLCSKTNCSGSSLRDAMLISLSLLLLCSRGRPTTSLCSTPPSPTTRTATPTPWINLAKLKAVHGGRDSSAYRRTASSCSAPLSLATGTATSTPACTPATASTDPALSTAPSGSCAGESANSAQRWRGQWRAIGAGCWPI